MLYILAQQSKYQINHENIDTNTNQFKIIITTEFYDTIIPPSYINSIIAVVDFGTPKTYLQQYFSKILFKYDKTNAFEKMNESSADINNHVDTITK